MIRRFDNLFEGGEWDIEKNPATLKSRGYYPNKIARSRKTGEVVILTVMQNGGDCYATCERAVKDAADRVRRGVMPNAYVVQCKKNDFGELIVERAETILNVERNIGRQPSNVSEQRNQQWGDYWWLTSEFMVSVPGSGTRWIDKY